MAHRQALASGTVVGEDYEIERVLGSGGFGITYLAKDTSLGIEVAIKEYFPASLAYREAGATVHPTSDTDEESYNWGLERFLAEARTLARLRHPNIVRVSRYFRANGTAYMVLGFVVGQDLEAWLRSLGRAPKQKELDAIVGPLLDALTVVHGADIVHRDIKPANIYIQKSDRQPILLDFGAARQALGEQTRATAAFVSPGYSPPESHLNDPAQQGPWTDIYGLAATLYRAIVGKPPVQVVHRLSDDTDIPVAEQIPNAADYRPGFLAAIDSGMKLRREDRPQSVAAWRTQLFSTLSDQNTVVRRGDDTVVRGGGDAETVVRTGSGQPETIARQPPSDTNKRRIVVGAIALLGVAALYYIYSSFEQGLRNGPPGQTQITRPTTSPAQPAQTQEQPPQGFTLYRNARFGYSLSYPRDVLAPQDPPQNGAGRSFANADGSFVVDSFASFNSDGSSSESYLAQLREDNPRYRDVRATTSDSAGFSLVLNSEGRLSAYIAIFTCSNQIINVLEVNFPTTGPNVDRDRDIADKVVNSFRTGRGEDTPQDCTDPGAEQGLQAPAPQPAPAPQRDSSTTFPTPPQTEFFADQSLRRLATYGWSASGIQNGLWTASINSDAGSLLYLKCSSGTGAQRSGRVELHLNGVSLSGDQQVNAIIGDYTDGGVLTFTQQAGASVGVLQIQETDETAGNFLRFLRAVAAGQSIVLQLPGANIQDEFNLFEAGRALGPCLGQSAEQPWFNDGERDGVIGTGVRNADGGAFYLRCDTSPQSRGNALFAFAGRQARGIPTNQTGVINAYVGNSFNELEFIFSLEPDVLTGFIYHVNAEGGGENVKEFLELLSGGNELRLLNEDLGIDETFTLSGSRDALSGCAGLY